jgi:hypothetical protein
MFSLNVKKFQIILDVFQLMKVGQNLLRVLSRNIINSIG